MDDLQPKRDEALVNKVCLGIIQGKYWAILGPRFFGKTSFLRQIEERLRDEPRIRPIFIPLRDYSHLPRLEFYKRLYRDIRKLLGVEDKEIPGITIAKILEDILQDINERVILLFSAIDPLNEDIARELLLSLRRCYDQRTSDETYGRLGVVVSGSINLGRLSRGKASPFNIAEIEFLTGLSEEEGDRFIEELSTKSISEEAKKNLLRLTDGHPYLIKTILQLTKGGNIDSALSSFIKKGVNDPCLETIVRDIERSEETFRVFKEIQDGRKPSLLEPIFPTEPEITGLFKRRDDSYEVSNDVFSRFLKEYFDNQRLGDLFLLHSDWGRAKEFYKKFKGKRKIRKDVIGVFGRVMMREKDILKVESLVREGARYLMGLKKPELLRMDELPVGKYDEQDTVNRAISRRRIAFDKNSLVLPLFFGENEVRWILRIKGIVDIDEELLEEFRINAGLALENAYVIKLKLEIETHKAAIKVALQSLEERDPYTRGHSDKVAGYCRQIVDRLDEELIKKTGMTREEFKEIVFFAGMLHDIGKIGIAEDVLCKEGVLEEEERLEMNTHPYSSKEIMGADERFKKIAKIILHHHERENGSGYPYGLKGDEIPLGSKILAIADSFDAMTSNRVYREAMRPEMALAEIKMLSLCDDPWYDRQVWNAFFSVIKDKHKEHGMKKNIDIDNVYDQVNHLLLKDYLDGLLIKILKEIKGKSEKTISVMMLSLDEGLDKEKRIPFLKQIKKNLPKSALFGNYDTNRYIVLFPNERAKDVYVRAEKLRKCNNKMNIGIYEPLSSDKDKGLEVDDIYLKVESAHKKAIERKRTIISRG